jgi:NADH dehydrogenase (ubiquinone) Fe-S protein 1
VSDAIGSNLRIDVRGTQVLRALPRLNDNVNEEWISDKARMSVDGLHFQRIDTPLIKNKQTGQFEQQTWTQALTTIRNKFSSIKIKNPNADIKGMVGDLTDAESIIALKDFVNALGSSNTQHADGLSFQADLRTHYLFNTQISNLDESDCIVLVGTNPRMEAPILNAGIGPEADLALDNMKWLGNDSDVLAQLVDEKSDLFNKVSKAKKPVVIFGSSMFTSQTLSSATVNLMETLQTKHPNLWNKENGWKGINVLQASASRVAALDLGFVQGPDVEETAVPKVLFAVGADSVNVTAQIKKMREVHGDDSLVIYMGSHGDLTAPVADVTLPSTAFTEKHTTYVNTEGRIQKTAKAVGNKNVAQDDWKTIRALSEVIGVALPYNNVDEVAQRIQLVAPTFTKPNRIEEPSLNLKYDTTTTFEKGQKLQTFLDNHFMTNAICRASPTMAKLSQEMPNSKNSYKL